MLYQTPGVIIEELTSPGPIAGVGTSIAAFLGPAPQGRRDPFMVTNWTQFRAEYGDEIVAPTWKYYLGHAVRGFFANGGSVAYIVRTGSVWSALALTDTSTPPKPTLIVEAQPSAVSIPAITVEVTTNGPAFGLKVVQGSTTENFSGLSLDSTSPQYALTVVNRDSKLVTVRRPDGAAGAVAPAAAGPTPLERKDDEANPLNYYNTALTALEAVAEVNLIAAPGQTNPDVLASLVAHCQRLKNRFALLDGPANQQQAALTLRQKVDSDRGFAAFYYPWITIPNPSGKAADLPLPIPPSGHLAGIFARSDSEQGVHKAPANEPISGAVGLTDILTDTEQGELNKVGINALRIFPGSARPIVWGARTTAPQDETTWRYINVRRLFLFIEASIQEGIRWAVFEPNNKTLWKRLERTITEFLGRVWRDGALFGDTAAQAFYVKIDEELNPASVRALGQVIIEIGLAPVSPAEFVVVRIGLWDGGNSTTEG